MDEIKNDINVAILYVDGSAGPNPGYCGSGVHGYIYNTDTIDTKSGEKPNGYTITNIGYIENNIFPRSQTKTVIPSHYIDGVYGYIDSRSNNYGEVMAIIYALEDVVANEELNISKVIIKSDSTYALSILHKSINKLSYEHLDKNLELYEHMGAIVKHLQDKGVEIAFDKVVGHSTDLGNNLSDVLAVHGKHKSATFNIDKDLNIVSSKKYWTNKIDCNTLLDFKQIFFCKHLSNNDVNDVIYSVMRYKTDVEPGTKTHEATFGIVVLKDHVKEIKDIIDVYEEGVGHRSSIATINLQELYKRDNMSYYNMLGKSTYKFNRRTGSVHNLFNTPILYNIKPTGLATLAMEKMMSMYSNVVSYRDKTLASRFVHVIDISNMIYNVDSPKYETILENGTNDLVVPYNINGKDIKIKLDLITDTLSRNQFKRIERKKPKVMLVLNMVSERYVEYYTLVETSDEEIGIYFSLYSNRIIL